MRNPSRSPSIRAEVHSDDYAMQIHFNAVSWLRTASDAAIRALAACDWGGDYPADAVARDLADQNADLEQFFRFEAYRRVGFECHVDAADALAWLAVHRPPLYRELAP